MDKVTHLSDILKTPVTILHGKNPTPLFISTLGEVFSKMTETTKREFALELRQLALKAKETGDDKLYKYNKDNLIGFLVGEWKYRADAIENCITYLPFLVLDWDFHLKYEGDFEPFSDALREKVINALKSDPHIIAVFYSPSGGLRCIVWAKSTYETHRIVYKQVMDYISHVVGLPILKCRTIEGQKVYNAPFGIDPVCINESRFFYFVEGLTESEFYINAEPVEFDPQAHEIPKMDKAPEMKSDAPKSQNKAHELTEAQAWETLETMVNKRHSPTRDSGRNGRVLFLAQLAHEHGFTESEILSYCEKFVQPDFDLKEIRATVKSAIKRTTFQRFSREQLANYAANGEGAYQITPMPNTLEQVSATGGPAKQNTAPKNERYTANTSHLAAILDTQKKLRERKARPVIFSPPIISHKGNAVIYPNTINVIQGQAGSHKSRVSELICSTLLGNEIELAGFQKVNEGIISVCVVDTERNTSEQLPCALQSIQTKAGYRIEEDPNGFDYISLLPFKRSERFRALREYLDYIRTKYDTHIFIVLDVLTDCCEDFNRTEYSLELIDHLNNMINEYNVTFLCVIHENPGHAKARGHLGTELTNKASTVMQVGYEQDATGKDTDLIRLKFLKCRNTRRHDPIYLKYCDTFKGLVLADESEVNKAKELRKTKAAPADVAERIEFYLQEKAMVGSELIELLMKDFDAAERTIEERIKEIIATDTGFFKDGIPCSLVKFKDKRNVMFALEQREKSA